MNSRIIHSLLKSKLGSQSTSQSETHRTGHTGLCTQIHTEDCAHNTHKTVHTTHTGLCTQHTQGCAHNTHRAVHTTHTGLCTQIHTRLDRSH